MLVRGAARLAVLLLALRAFVPVGYMPDVAALAEGRVQIVLCSGRTVALSHAGHEHDHGGQRPSDTRSGDECAFGVALGKALLLPGLADVPPPPHVPTIGLAAGWYGGSTPVTAGPPLGPRAPPSRLA
jgi:hypothetical protein